MNSVTNDPPGTGRRPVIGICARTAPVTLQGSDLAVSLALQSHVAFLSEAGCTPLLLPLLPGAADLADRLDGLLIPGGPDLDPALYGQDPHPATRAMSPDADRVELALARRALDAGLPVLAICRGMQLLNVLHGGTLEQHLPDTTGDDGHRPRTASFTLGRHPLKLRPDSRIAAVLDEDEPRTACHHHQAVGRSAPASPPPDGPATGSSRPSKSRTTPSRSVCNGNAGRHPTGGFMRHLPKPPDVRRISGPPKILSSRKSTAPRAESFPVFPDPCAKEN